MFKAFFFLIFYLYSVYTNELPCKCRLRHSARIVNGKIATDNYIPWIVSLANVNDIHFCGATIVNKNFVLTSSHCTEDYIGKMIKIRVGINDVTKIDKKKVYYAKRVIRHVFKKAGDFGDFSLIELKSPIQFKVGEIEPACFNFKDVFFEGDLLSAGWGRTSRTWRDVNDKSGQIHYLPKNTNKLKYYFSFEVLENCANYNICTMSLNKIDSACNGDSGGPLMYSKNGKTSVVGMASFTNSVKEGDKVFYCNGFVTYARLKMYIKFFKNFVNGYCEI